MHACVFTTYYWQKTEQKLNSSVVNVIINKYVLEPLCFKNTQVITVIAMDGDRGSPNNIEYSILNGNGSSYYTCACINNIEFRLFNIKQHTNVSLVTISLTPEKKSHRFEICVHCTKKFVI